MGLFTDPTTNARLRAIERKLDLIMAHLGLAEEPDPAGDLEPIRDLVRQNRKIEAIKLYREQTGVGLAEAKAVIDRLS